MKRFLFIAFSGLCILGTIIIGTNNSRNYLSGAQRFPVILLRDTIPSKQDTTTKPKPDTTKRKFSELVISRQMAGDSTPPPKPDTPKLIAYNK